MAVEEGPHIRDLTKLLGKQGQKNNPKRIRPKIAEAIRPNVVDPHPNQLFQNIVCVRLYRHFVPTTLRSTFTIIALDLAMLLSQN